MRKLITLILLASISILFLVSCDGGHGNGDEDFTVFDVLIDIETGEGHVFECPDSADLKLSLLIKENKISGFAELIAEGQIGDAEAIKGLVESGEFSLEPFVIEVIFGGGIFGPHVTKYDFQDFKGVFIDESADGIVNGLEGNASGRVFVIDGDAIYCDAEFTGEFEGEIRTPTGCLSISEYTSVSEYWACPAVAISSLCDGDGWFCGLPAPPPLAGDGYITNLCEAVDCHTIVNCELAPDITNLEDGPGLSGNVILQDGSIGEPIYGCSSFSFGY
jgi:hypothetical protein